MPARPIWIHAGPVVRATLTGGNPVQADIGTTNNQNIVDITGAGEIVVVYDAGFDDGRGGSPRNFGANSITFSTLDMSQNIVDTDGHGTHVAGTIAHTDSNGAKAGIARGADLFIQLQGDVSEFAKNLDEAYNAGARIHNNSWAEDYRTVTQWNCVEVWVNGSLDTNSCSATQVTNSTKYDVRRKSGTATDQQGAVPTPPYFKGRPQNATKRAMAQTWLPAARYGDESQVADDFAVKKRDLVIVAGASNTGPDPSSIGAPGTAKNVITVGSVRNDLPTTNDAPGYITASGGFGSPGSTTNPVHPDKISHFSSRGPTDDGRVKPDVVAPGEAILAPLSQKYEPDCKKMRFGTEGNAVSHGTITTALMGPFAYSCGTSMATPVVSACVALVREWLARKHNVTAPSSSLVKALIINGAERISGFKWGDAHQGWGRVNLANVLDPQGGRLLCWSDEAYALAQGKTAEFQIDLAGHNPGSLKFTLVWLDPAGAVAQTTSDLALVNNLDLHVEAPSGKWCAANSFNNAGTASEPHNSQQTGDAINNVECVILDSVDHSNDNSAIYKIYVVATKVTKTSVGAQHTNLSAAAQSFALVVSGVPANTTFQVQVY